ncbi:MAG: hypothetical protein Q9163_001141 [Psora crenata]
MLVLLAGLKVQHSPSQDLSAKRLTRLGDRDKAMALALAGSERSPLPSKSSSPAS